MIIQLKSAEIITAKQHPIKKYVGVLVKDPYLGQVWFRTNITAAMNMRLGNLITATLTVINRKGGTTFCKNPTNIVIEDEPIRFYKD